MDHAVPVIAVVGVDVIDPHRIGTKQQQLTVEHGRHDTGDGERPVLAGFGSNRCPSAAQRRRTRRHQRRELDQVLCSGHPRTLPCAGRAGRRPLADLSRADHH